MVVLHQKPNKLIVEVEGMMLFSILYQKLILSEDFHRFHLDMT
jgi:hypothetical protein